MKNRFFAIAGWTISFAFCLLLILLLQRGQRPKEAPMTQPTQATQLTQEAQTLTQVESKPSEPLSKKIQVVVSRVIDGDTVELTDGRRVRLIGIDTPEKGRPYFEEAKDKLIQLVEGKQVVLEKDISERDRYGRLLRYIWLDSTFINLEMVRQGFANCYTCPPDVRHQSEILQAEREARQKQIGLWGMKDKTPGPYVASKNREPFHRLTCPWTQKISEQDKVYFNSREEAIRAGHRPCHVCKP